MLKNQYNYEFDLRNIYNFYIIDVVLFVDLGLIVPYYLRL